MSATKDTHLWVSNSAFTRLSGFRKVCIRCRLGLVKGERLVERECPAAEPKP